MKFASVSRENPRRFWVQIPGVGEIRLYLWGVELLIGRAGCFYAIGFGTADRFAEWVRTP